MNNLKSTQIFLLLAKFYWTGLYNLLAAIDFHCINFRSMNPLWLVRLALTQILTSVQEIFRDRLLQILWWPVMLKTWMTFYNPSIFYYPNWSPKSDSGYTERSRSVGRTNRRNGNLNSSDDCWICDNLESIRSNSALHSTKLKT